MRWVKDNSGNVIIAAMTVILGVLFGILTFDIYNDGAEAVLGGGGNLTNTLNPHNLSASSAGINASSETQICVFCHTPHYAIVKESSGQPILNAPLWNHTLSTQTYTLKSAGFQNQGAPTAIVNMLTTPIQPDGASRLCMSCHDGTLSVGSTVSLGNITMNTNSCLSSDGKLLNTGGCAGLGTDLAAVNKHVVSVPMNSTLKAAHLANCQLGIQTTRLEYPWDTSNGDIVILRPTTATFGGSGGVNRNTGKYKDGYDYGVQCSTCHDPHYWTTDSDDTVEGYMFLVKPVNASPSLCEACHVSGCP